MYTMYILDAVYKQIYIICKKYSVLGAHGPTGTGRVGVPRVETNQLTNQPTNQPTS